MLPDDSVAFVTGAGRGIGRQVASDLAAAGAAVALVARSADQVERVAAAIVERGGRAIAVSADVSDRAAVEAAIRRTESELGPISLAVNNAGIDRPFGPVEAVDPDKWWHTQAIHVLGSYIVMHAVLPGMRQRRRGRIINVVSSAATMVAPNSSAYCVAKSSLLRLTEHVDAEIRDAGLAAFAIDPGTVMTDMGHSAIADPDAQKWLKPLVDHLSAFRDVDPQPALDLLGRNFVALAGGGYDALSGRMLHLDRDLDAELRAATTQA